MKKFKSYFTYAVIILICIVTFTDFLFQKSNGSPISALRETSAKTQSKVPDSVRAAMEKAAEALDSNPVVGIGMGKDYGTTTETAIKNIGGIKNLIKEGNVVLIKPNICTLSKPGTPVITDYRVVRKVAEMALEYGAKKVIVAEGPINGNAFSSSSLKSNKYGTIPKVELLNLNNIEKNDCYLLKPENGVTGKAFYIPKVYMDADVVISIAKLKTHNQAVISLSLKNVFGIPSEKIYGGYGFKGGLHALGMDQAIVDLNLIRRPDVAIIEGIVGGEGDGPINNTPVKSKIILAGRDLLALDTAALTFMGFTVDQVPHIKLAAKMKMGVSDLSKIKIVGADLDSIKMDFKSGFKKK